MIRCVEKIFYDWEYGKKAKVRRVTTWYFLFIPIFKYERRDLVEEHRWLSIPVIKGETI